MTIDLKRRVAILAGSSQNATSQGSTPHDTESQDSSAVYADMERQMMSCNAAFNRGDAKTLADCFDPEIILYTPHGEYRGRQQVVGYLSEHYFKFAPNLRYSMQPHDIRMFADALWYSYDYEIDTPVEHFVGHGMSMCRKDAAGRWHILNMHNSLRDAARASNPVH